MSEKEERDRRLDELKELFDTYMEKEKKRIDRQIALLESILEGHGVEGLQKSVIDTISSLAETEISEFLS